MTKNVSKSNPTVYQELVNVSGEKLNSMIANHELTIPKPEREDFFKFVKMNPEERTAFVSKLSPIPDSNAAGAQPDPKSGSVQPVPPQSGVGIPPVPPVPASGPKPETGSEYLVDIDKLQTSLKAQRAKNGELGQTVKTLKEREAELLKQIENLQKATPSAQADTMPVMPDLPDPDKYVEGIYDEEYKKAAAKYRDDLKQYNANLNTYFSSKKPAWAEELSQKLESVKTKAEQASAYVEQTTQNLSASRVETALNDMWQDVKALQSAVGLKTSVPIDILNRNQIIVNSQSIKNSDGSPLYSAEEVAAATNVIKSVPEKEYENFKSMVKIVGNLYKFDVDGTPMPMYDIDKDLAWQAAIRKAGISGLTAVVPKPLKPDEMSDRLSQQQHQQAQYPDSMNGSQIGASDDSIRSPSGTLEKQKQLLEMAQRIQKNPSLLRDRKIVEEYDKLRQELGLARK